MPPPPHVDDDGRVKVVLANGQVKEADLVIGADGINSKTAQILNGKCTHYHCLLLLLLLLPPISISFAPASSSSFFM